MTKITRPDEQVDESPAPATGSAVAPGPGGATPLPDGVPSGPGGVTSSDGGAPAPDGPDGPDGAPDGAAATPVPAPDGRSARWDDHRSRRRDELARAARRAIHRGGPDISMDEIAAAAGTSKPIYYRYFGDRKGLRRAVGQAVVAEMRAAMLDAARSATTTRGGLEAMVAVYLSMVRASPNVYRFVTHPMRDDSLPAGPFVEALAAAVARPFVQVLAKAHVQPAATQAWAAGAVGFVRGAGEWWLAHRDDPDCPDVETLTADLAEWLWSGLSPALRSHQEQT